MPDASPAPPRSVWRVDRYGRSEWAECRGMACPEKPRPAERRVLALKRRMGSFVREPGPGSCSGSALAYIQHVLEILLHPSMRTVFGAVIRADSDGVTSRWQWLEQQPITIRSSKRPRATVLIAADRPWKAA